MSCNGVRKQIWKRRSISGGETFSLYVCNCNGIRERDVRAAIDQGATRPADIFRHAQCKPECAKCVCDMRCMIEEQAHAMRFAAE
jgi:bacterioferritin-associated ferredoxin